MMLKISEEGSKSFLVHRPNTGVQSRPEELKSLKKKYTLVRIRLFRCLRNADVVINFD